MFKLTLRAGLALLLLSAVEMTFPRFVAPDLNTFFTRVTDGQTFFFAPSPDVNAAFGYLLALMSERYGVAIHAATVMADHVHVELTDRRGNLPAAIQWFGALTARSVNRILGRNGTVYDPREPPDYVYPRCHESVLDRMTYTMNNPVHHGAVRYSRDYPGLAVQPEWYLEPRTFERPGLFRDREEFPPTATLRLDLPDDYSHLSREAFVALLRRELDALELATHRDRVSKGLGYLGPSRCSRLDWRRTAKLKHAPGSRVQEAIARDRERKKLFRRMLRSFRRAYHQTRARWRSGDRQVKWPYGTWKMRYIDGFPTVGVSAGALSRPPP